MKWRISDFQLKKLKRVCKNVVSALDNTDTGERGTDILREHFDIVIRFPFSEDRKDVGALNDHELMMAKRELFRLRKKLEHKSNIK